jgi:hypothetical protein
MTGLLGLGVFFLVFVNIPLRDRELDLNTA